MYVLAGAAVAFVAWKYFSKKEEENGKDLLEAAVLKSLYDFNSSIAGLAQIIEQKNACQYKSGFKQYVI